MVSDVAGLKKDLARRMDGAVEVLHKEFTGLRTGRASASLLEPVMVEAYGVPTPLNQVASVSVPESRMLSVQVWDKTMVKSVEKAIRDAGLGLNPGCRWYLVRVPIPPLNEERRTELSKVAVNIPNRPAFRFVTYAVMGWISLRNGKRTA